MKRCILICLGSVYSTGLFAATQVQAATPYHPETQLLKIVVIMVALIAMILMFGFVLRKMMTQLGIKTDDLKVLASIPLGTRERILLVKVGSKQYLIGATSYHIQTLCEVEESLQGLSDTSQSLNFKKVLEFARVTK